MILLVTPDRYGEFVSELTAMHELRYRVFKQRLGWEVETAAGLEVDTFDALEPHYLLLRSQEKILGCVRFLPSAGPTMLRDTFPALLPPDGFAGSADTWESSRFALDLHNDLPKAASTLSAATYELFIGMVEFGLAHHLRRIVTVTDVRMERILRRAGWPLARLSSSRPIGVTHAVAGTLEVSRVVLASLRNAGGFQSPVLWSPVLERAA